MNIDWTNVKNHRPVDEPGRGIREVLIWTPDNQNMEYRVVPLFMAVKLKFDFTHWAYLTPPNDIKER